MMSLSFTRFGNAGRILVGSVTTTMPRRSFRSSSAKWQQTSSPYAVLGVPEKSSYDIVKRGFVQAALRHHPDRPSGDADIFVQIREAFETICNAQNQSGLPDSYEKHDLKSWIQKEEGSSFLNFEMSESTRQEVIHAYKTLKPSGKDKGGYWDMARQLVEQEAMRSEEEKSGPLRQLTGSSVSRRKRRR